ncbi:MAG TPA: hypothetical protein VFS97_10710 [Nitrososphaeraceae archaeon]|nr:hypothetical protein [Nitrososphaeraceae archaeon]
MNKPNWVCVGCGMWSSRKYSVQRHISKVHDGYSMMVPFTEYIVGRQTGLYLPPKQAASPVSPGIKSRESEKNSPLDTMTSEFWKEMGREAARRNFQRRW